MAEQKNSPALEVTTPSDREIVLNGPTPGMDTFASARLRFLAMERWTYLDVAGRCPLSRTTRAAVDAHLDERMVNGANKEKFFDLIERARASRAS